MPTRQLQCETCKAELEYEACKAAFVPGAKIACPYLGMAYAELRAGHDRLYFGKWRRMDADLLEIRRAYHQIELHLGAIKHSLESTDLPAARRDLEKGINALHAVDPRDGGPEALRDMDHALSYAHRVIDDLLSEMGLPGHTPMDFAEWYDTEEVPFREEL